MSRSEHKGALHPDGCKCAAHTYATFDEPKDEMWSGHVCDVYCYHTMPRYKAKIAAKEKRAKREKLWNKTLGRLRTAYPKDRVVPLRLIGVIPLIVPDDSPVPPPKLIQEAVKSHANARNKRRRKRP